MSTNEQIESFTERVFLFLEEGDWGKANEYCERILDEDSRNQKAYLGKLMIDYHVRNEADLANLKKDFEQNINYQRIVRFGDPEFVQKIQRYLYTVKEQIQQKELEAQQRKREKQLKRQNKPLGMKWYKFLIWFNLPVSVLLDILEIMAAFIFGFSKDTSSQLKILYISYGIFTIGICFLTIVTIFRLAKFKKDAISFFRCLLGTNSLISMIYILISVSINGQWLRISYFIPIAAYLLLNMGYFEKRRMFFQDGSSNENKEVEQEQSDGDNSQNINGDNSPEPKNPGSGLSLGGEGVGTGATTNTIKERTNMRQLKTGDTFQGNSFVDMLNKALGTNYRAYMKCYVPLKRIGGTDEGIAWFVYMNNTLHGTGEHYLWRNKLSLDGNTIKEQYCGNDKNFDRFYLRGDERLRLAFERDPDRTGNEYKCKFVGVFLFSEYDKEEMIRVYKKIEDTYTLW